MTLENRLKFYGHIMDFMDILRTFLFNGFPHIPFGTRLDIDISEYVSPRAVVSSRRQLLCKLIIALQ